jgi:hypothetical protein
MKKKGKMLGDSARGLDRDIAPVKNTKGKQKKSTGSSSSFGDKGSDPLLLQGHVEMRGSATVSSLEWREKR